MKKMATLALILLFVMPLTATADEANRRQLAEQFLNVNKVKEQVDMMYEKIEGIIFSQLDAVDIPA